MNSEKDIQAEKADLEARLASDLGNSALYNYDAAPPEDKIELEALSNEMKPEQTEETEYAAEAVGELEQLDEDRLEEIHQDEIKALAEETARLAEEADRERYGDK